MKAHRSRFGFLKAHKAVMSGNFDRRYENEIADLFEGLSEKCLVMEKNMHTDIQTINIHQAKTHLSRLVEDVALSGQPIIIAKAGRPRVQIVPLIEEKPIRQMGTLKGKYPSLSLEEFNRLDNEITADFSGEIE